MVHCHMPRRRCTRAYRGAEYPSSQEMALLPWPCITSSTSSTRCPSLHKMNESSDEFIRIPHGPEKGLDAVMLPLMHQHGSIPVALHHVLHLLHQVPQPAQHMMLEIGPSELESGILHLMMPLLP